MKNTKIEWADHTWNPWRGCTKVSPGCAHCYAETLSKRNPAVLGEWGRGKPRVLAKNWHEPMAWNRKAGIRQQEYENRWDGTLRQTFKPESIPDAPERPMVFPSLCDWLDEEVPVAWLAEFMALVSLTSHLDWLLLTKRPENWRERIDAAALASTEFHQRWLVEWLRGTPPPNVWLGVSVEDQKRAAERILILLDTPARVRFLSVEPLLGPVDLAYTCFNGADSFGSMPGIDWVIVGGESGPKARPCNIEWILDIVRQCAAANVPCFVKQVGSRPAQHFVDEDGNPLGVLNIAITHPKGGDPAEWPEDIRVRQMPEVVP